MITALLLAVLSTCNPELWRHTYRHERFTVVDSCRSFAGTIEAKRREADGDIHIHLRLDAGQGKPLNHLNMARQNGCLVVEPVCIAPVKQKDAVEPCKGAPGVEVPAVGMHVRVRGVYVLDHEAGHGWMEIHAAEMEVLP